MYIKVCGIKYPANMLAIAATRPDIMGFIFYPGSPRYMGHHLTPDDLRSISPNIMKAGVFVNESSEEILRIAEMYGLDAVQLHGTESPEECEAVSRAGFSVFKAFSIGKDFSFEYTKPYASSCRLFLFDTFGKGYGGTGTHFNWEKLQSYNGSTPFLLSGGLGADDVVKLKDIKHPALAGYDINSKFEIRPGEKDVAKVERFIELLRS
ncbi:MAG: phosphoribosylanthranilate isomerase [Bacteroidota bacterium]|nr:phosphoribosylanthranilate isomerase [Bacteroidota bacterium]